MMVFGQKGKSGIIAALGLGQLGCLFGGILVAVLFLVIVGSAVLFEDDDAAATEMPSSGQSSVVAEALNIAYYLKMAGNQLDAFNVSATGPLLFPTKKYSSDYFTELYRYLAASHVEGNPAHPNPPNNVQCVAFVRAAYHMAGVPLPNDGLGVDDAYQYWGVAASWSGWTRIPNGQALPSPGDIIVLNNPGQPGHVSIVVSVNPPKAGQSTGTIMVAQGNAGSTTLTTQNDPRIQGLSVQAGIPLSELPYNPANNFVDSTWSNYTILGFLHNTKLEDQTGQQGTGTQ